jgi:hypothetical protein
VCVCAFRILSIQTLAFTIVMMLNYICRRDFIIVTSLVIFINADFISSSLSYKSRGILELLTNWCVLVVIVCRPLLSFFTSYFFFNLCDIWCVCALCKFTLYARLPYLPPTPSFRLLMLAATCFCRRRRSLAHSLRRPSHCIAKC